MVSRYSLNAMSRFPSLPEAERDLLLITVWGSSCPNRWQNQEDLPAPPNFILCFVPLVCDHLCESHWGAAHALIGALHGISLQEQPDMLMGWWDKADKTQHTSNVSLLDFPSLFFLLLNTTSHFPDKCVVLCQSLPGTLLSFSWPGEEQGTGVSEIPEISTQIKTFYQLLIAVQTNYIWTKLCQRLPWGIIIKIWAVEMRPHSVNTRSLQL